MRRTLILLQKSWKHGYEWVLKYCINLTMKSVNANIFFSCRLLRLHKPRSLFYAHDQTTGDFGIKCSRVAGLLNTQNPFDPCYYLVWTRIGRFVHVNESWSHIILKVSFQRRGAKGKRRIMIGAYIEFVKIFQQKRPLRGLKLRWWFLGWLQTKWRFSLNFTKTFLVLLLGFLFLWWRCVHF